MQTIDLAINDTTLQTIEQIVDQIILYVDLNVSLLLSNCFMTRVFWKQLYD
jgi:hypothetical protein